MFKNDKIYILYKTLIFCIICDKWAVMVKTYLLKKYQLKLNQIKSNSWFNKSCKWAIYVISNEYIITLQKNMDQRNINQKFRLKNLDEPRNYFTEEINQNDLIGKKFLGL